MEFDLFFKGREEYLAHGSDAYLPFWQRISYFQTAMTGMRLLYYTVWCFTEATMIGCGISYERSYKESAGLDKITHVWTRVQNVLIVDLEFAKSPMNMIPCWDIQTCYWVKEHFKERIDRDLKVYLGPLA
jgi:hypothetical protein